MNTNKKILSKVEFVISVLALLITNAAFPQVYSFQKLYGGEYDEGRVLIQLLADQFVFAGIANNSTPFRGNFIITTDNAGNIVNSHIYTGESEEALITNGIRSHDGLVFTGICGPWYDDSLQNAWILKLDFDGNINWSKAIGGNALDYGADISETKSGDLFITGFSKSDNPSNDIFLCKVDSTGNLVWSKHYGDPDTSENGAAIQVLRYNEILVAGSRFSSETFLVKFDDDGNAILNKTFTLPGDVITWDVAEATNGDFLVCGVLIPYSGPYSFFPFVLRTDANMNFKWIKSYIGTDWVVSESFSIVATPDNGAIIPLEIEQHLLSYTNPLGLLKLDSVGDVNWVQLFSYHENLFPWQVIQLFDGNYAVAGYKRWSEGAYFLKTTNSNTPDCDDTTATIMVDDILILQESTFGSTYDSGNMSTLTLQDSGGLSLNSVLCEDSFIIFTNQEIVSSSNNNLNLQPNPNNGVFEVRYQLPQNKEGMLTITNQLGELVYKEKSSQWSTICNINVSKLPQGIYLVTIESDGKRKSVKFVKQ